MIQIIEPRTKRLHLRQWALGDHDPFAAMSADPQVMKYLPNTLNRDESDAIAEKCQSLIAENGWGVWAVELIETNEFIGIIGLHIPSAHFLFSPCVEILWRLARPYWGYGYAVEAARAALNVGFEKLDLHRDRFFFCSEQLSFSCGYGKAKYGQYGRDIRASRDAGV